MSELTGGSAGTGRGNGGIRATQAPAPSQPATAAVLTPRQIMNQRQQREAEREAKKRAEAEAEEQRRTDEERIRNAERRATAAGVAPQREPTYRGAGNTSQASGQTPYMATGQVDPGGSGYVRRQPPEYPLPRSSGSTSRQRAPAPTEQSRIPPQQSAQYGTFQPTSQPQGQPRVTTGGGSSSQPARGGTGTSAEGQQQRNSNVSSFPHAFERWEQLSSRWEGLTGYWIRKLEQNSEDIQGNITTQQLSRQITDLSAAGANLFHAVVELQRLRASSERKFQRWFFETRAQQEQAQEREAQLEKQLEEERQGRADVVEADRIRRNTDRSLVEMRRELQISKDEARRAWEELGKREELERDRTMALRSGRAIEIGGVQVVPTSASVSRGGSIQRPSTREGYQGQQTPAGVPTTREQVISEYEQQEPSPTNTDPFTEPATSGRPAVRPPPPGGYPQYPTAATVQAPGISGTIHQQRAITPTRATEGSSIPTSQSTASAFYRQQPTLLHDPTAATAPPPQSAFSGHESEEGSEEDVTYELDDQGNVRVDSAGNPIPYRGGYARRGGGSDDEYDVGEDVAREQAQASLYSRVPTTSAPQAAPPTSAYQAQRTFDTPADYDGTGFGNGTGWETIQRHHHPTRLSDVLEEEDERSRTSPSRASQGSRGIY